MTDWQELGVIVGVDGSPPTQTAVRYPRIPEV